MKKISILSLVAVILTSLFMASCASNLKPLGAQQVQTTPQPLVLKGGKVPASITINFPNKWFNKKAEIKVTPVLKYAGGEKWGTTYSFQGEKIRGNATTVKYLNPSPVTLHTEFDYEPAMQKSDLVLIFVARINNKEVKLPEVKIGEGVIATEALADVAYVTPATAPDAFQRIIKEKYNADILFLIQQANLRGSELSKGEVKEWKGIVESADITPNQKVDVEVQAYASPDGGRDLNEKLASKREANTTQYIKRELKKSKVDAPVAAHYTAQDWEGFKELVEKSNIQDKDLVLRVLSMYNDPEVREREIKNISSVFSQLADEILPQLRRSRLVANVEIIGKSDEEIARLSKQNPGSLNTEELLYSATLADTPAEKKRIYTHASQLFPKDPRGFNNLGVLAMQEGDMALAEHYFTKASEVASNNNITSQETLMNQGLMALNNGEISKAEALLGQAGNVPELGEALGLIYMKQGKYADAAKALYDVATNNGVLAQILNSDYAQALRLLEKIVRPDATTHYLKALLGARTANTSLIEEGIRKAVQLSPAMASKFIADREFARYATQSFFTDALR